MNTADLGSWIAHRARMTPSKIACIFGEKKYTYEMLHRRILKSTQEFHTLGLKKHDRIGYLGSNHPAFIETMFATVSLGAVFVPIHPGFSVSDIAYIINDAGCSVLVYNHDTRQIVDEIRSEIHVNHFVMVSHDISTGLSVESIPAYESTASTDQAKNVNDLCVIAYTSGTTGRPKGVMLSHANLLWNVINILSCADYTSDDVLLVQAPLYRLGGLGMMVLPGLFKGATLVITHEKTPPVEIVTQIDRYRITLLFGGPEFFKTILTTLNGYAADISSVRFCICGGDIIPESLIRAWLERGVRFQQGYGQTEAAPMLLLLDKDEMLTKIGSSGKSPLFTRVRVVHPDMTDVKPDEIGEVIARGPNIMKGYWNLPDITAKKISPDGWLRTGDAARIDSDGHTYILGRIDDALNINGKLLFPAEIEKIISGYPEVTDSAVAAITIDGKYNLSAFVVLKSNIIFTITELRQRLHRDVPVDAIPEVIKIVNEIPRNPNGKIIRNKLQVWSGDDEIHSEDDLILS